MSSDHDQCPPFDFSSRYYHVEAGAGSCVRQSSFFEGKAVLNQGVGYSVILGFGAFFAVFTSFLVIPLQVIICESLHSRLGGNQRVLAQQNSCLAQIYAFYLCYIVTCSGVVREAICWFTPYIRVVQHRWQECQNGAYCQCHCLTGNVSMSSAN